MEGGGRQVRLLSRLLGRLRGDHHKYALDKRFSLTSTVTDESSPPYGHNVANSVFYYNEAPHLTSMSESTACSTTNEDEDLLCQAQSPNVSTCIDDGQFAANIDLSQRSSVEAAVCLVVAKQDTMWREPNRKMGIGTFKTDRYGGQYLSPEQLPDFCDQLHHLVEVIRNIQSYAHVTGEYPSELERRLEQEAREVAAIAAEARNARETVARVRAQRCAVRAYKKNLLTHLTSLRESEFRELESTVRLSDRKLFKNWESLKDSTDPAAFQPLLDEIKNKQTALECLLRLVHSKQSALSRATPTPTPLPPPEPMENDESGGIGASGGSGGRKRHDTRETQRSATKRRRREPRSVPLSEEPSRHAPPPQVTLFIQGTESTSRYRVGSAGAVALTPLELPTGGSVRDILFFTTN